MPNVAERTLELAKEALAEQEREVADLRNRGSALMAAAGVVAGLFGDDCFAGTRPDGFWPWLFTVTGVAAGTALIGCAAALLSIRRLAYALNARTTYEALYTGGTLNQPEVDLALAGWTADVRLRNRATAGRLHLCLVATSAGFIVFTTGLAAAAALGS